MVGTCLASRRNREGIFSRELVIPEERFIANVKELATKIDDPRLPLNALFCVLPCVFSQWTYRFFRQIEKPELIAEYCWLFQPEKVIQAQENGVDVFGEYIKYFGVDPKYYRPPIEGIIYNCQVLNQKYGSSVLNYFKTYDNDAERIAKALIVRDRAKSYEKEFRRLGPKLTPLLIQFIDQYKMAELKNTDKVGLPVDMQLARLLVQTGAITYEGWVNAYKVVSKTAHPLFKELCEQNGWSLQEVSETLWLLGSNGCTLNKHGLCPVEHLCDTTLSSQEYYKKGRFVQGRKRIKDRQFKLDI